MASELYADDASARLHAAVHVHPKQRRQLERQAATWPADSPGAINAWLLMVTTKPPTWRDPLFEWREQPPTLGAPHEGFFYPDPLGFWSEIRHWATKIVDLPITEALTVSAVLHGADRLPEILELTQAAVVLFLDEPAWQSSRLAVSRHSFSIRDPFRAGKTYDGWWGFAVDEPRKIIVGKAPQHPAAHKLYDRADMDRFLTAATAPVQTTRT